MNRSRSPNLRLMLSWLRGQPWIPGFIRRLPVRVRSAVARAVAIVFIATFGVAIYFGGTGSRLHQLPNREVLIDVFFRTAFVPVIVLLIAWYIASLKHAPARAREYVFLNSLPLSSDDIHQLFLVSGLCGFLWVPFAMAVLLSALAVAAPVSFLIRLIGLMLGAYVLLQIAGITLQLVVSLWRANGKSVRFPDKNSPLIQLVVVMAYAVMPVIWTLYPRQITGESFWVVVVTCALAAIALVAVSRRIFARCHRTNVVLGAMATMGGRSRMGYRVWARVLGAASVSLKSNPLLVRNLVRSTRETAIVPRLVLASFFVALSFLMAMNNESVRDMVAVLSGAFYVYAFFVVVKAMDRVEEEEEPPALIYSLPVTTAQLYLSLFVPTMGWLAAIALVQAILVILAGGGVALAGRFLLKAVLVAAVLCGISASAAVSGYPGRRNVLKRFLACMLVLAVAVVIFYNVWLIAITAVSSLSLLLLLRKRLYRT